MMLNPEAREIVRQAALEAFTRHLTADEVFDEVVRLCRDAKSPKEIEAIGRVIGEITALGKMIVAAGAPEPEKPEPGGAVAGVASEPESDAGCAVAEQAEQAA